VTAQPGVLRCEPSTGDGARGKFRVHLVGDRRGINGSLLVPSQLGTSPPEIRGAGVGYLRLAHVVQWRRRRRIGLHAPLVAAFDPVERLDKIVVPLFETSTNPLIGVTDGGQAQRCDGRRRFRRTSDDLIVAPGNFLEPAQIFEIAAET
jgi:hypothetical protein